jgi:hypothetical protein
MLNILVLDLCTVFILSAAYVSSNFLIKKAEFNPNNVTKFFYYFLCLLILVLAIRVGSEIFSNIFQISQEIGKISVSSYV